MTVSYSLFHRQVIYALGCALHGISPTELSDADLGQILSAAGQMGVEAMVCSSLEKIGRLDAKGREILLSSIRRAVLFKSELSRVCAALSDANIRHARLKGAVIEDLYPSVGMRRMTDIDLLTSAESRSVVREVMLSLGYEATEYGHGCHDVYMKAPVFNFEIHQTLFSSTESRVLAEYFDNALDRAASAEGSELRFSTEDQYLYVKAHEYKHYTLGGIGIRGLVDTYVYNRAHADMDRNYLDRELSQIGILDFERQSVTLAQKLLSPEGCRGFLRGELPLTDGESEMLRYYLGSGVFGNMQNKVDNMIAREGGRFASLKYVFHRVFPPLEWYETYAPFYYKHRALIPFFVIKRGIVKVVRAPGRIISELKKVKNSKRK